MNFIAIGGNLNIPGFIVDGEEALLHAKSRSYNARDITKRFLDIKRAPFLFQRLIPVRQIYFIGPPRDDLRVLPLGSAFLVSPIKGSTHTFVPFSTRLSAKGLYRSLSVGYLVAKMRTLEQVESDVRMLPPEKQEELRDWLENLLEDQLELTDEFKAKIERGELDLRVGRSPVRKP